MTRKIVAALVSAVLGSLLLPAAWSVVEEAQSAVELGKGLAFDRKKGNCLACHVIAGGDLAGNIGPPLVAMKMRFPDKADLRAQIYDAFTKNPRSVMPRFGPHRALTDEQIDLITEYVYTL